MSFRVLSFFHILRKEKTISNLDVVCVVLWTRWYWWSSSFNEMYLTQIEDRGCGWVLVVLSVYDLFKVRNYCSQIIFIIITRGLLLCLIVDNITLNTHLLRKRHLLEHFLFGNCLLGYQTAQIEHNHEEKKHYL